jgi:hypothetical protein
MLVLPMARREPRVLAPQLVPGPRAVTAGQPRAVLPFSRPTLYFIRDFPYKRQWRVPK